MQLELEFGKYFCYARTFTVNGIDADTSDFGEQYDRNPEDAEPYGCGNMRFTRIDPKHEVLAKYEISETEYHEIASELEDGLSFGYCGWCV